MSSTNQAIFNDPRARRWGNFAKIAALIVVGFFIAPFIWIAIGGLIGLFVAIVLCVAAWMIRPWIYSVAANARLALVKAEAQRNPVETLEEDLRKKTVALDGRRTNIELLNGQIRTFSDKVDGVREKYGKENSAYIKLNTDLSDLRRCYKQRCEKWNEAHRQLGLFAEQIEFAKTIWDASLTAMAAKETSGMSEDEFFAKLKTDTAIDTIQANYNLAIASLDTDLNSGSVGEPSKIV